MQQESVHNSTLLEHLLNLTNDAFYVADEKGQLLHVNEKACENIGLARQELMQKTIQELDVRFKSSQTWEVTLRQLRSQKNMILGKTEEKAKTPCFPTETKLSYLQCDGYEYIIAVALDTSEKKNAEELLMAKKAKEQFLANMSHEIRTPINGISGMLNLLADTEVTPDQKKYINAIRNAADNLKVIINDILDVSAIESGKLKFERIGFKIDYQVVNVIQSFEIHAKEKGIEIKHNIDKEARIVLLGDPVRLNQILMNLIGNALKFTFSGEIVVDVRVAKRQKDKLFVKFSVRDSGIGIPKDKLDVIFESFRQADESVTRRFGGTGLGLTICKQLTEMQGGTISVKSEEGKGTAFSFIIPYEVGTNADLVSIKSDEQNGAKSGVGYEQLKGLYVLLVEDNDINRIYAKNTAQKWGCKVDIAENGLIALEKIRRNNYDIILMDIQMPVMDGFEATKAIRNKFEVDKSNVPIIALTANAIKGDNEKCIEAGMNDYISKPFAPRDLYNVLRRYVKASPAVEIEKSREEILDNKTDEAKTLTDLTYLKGVCDGDENFIVDMVSSFITDVPLILEEMQEHKKKRRWKPIGKLAHKLKPSVQFMGIHSLEDTVKAIETDAFYSSDIEELPNKVEKLINILSLAIPELAQQLEAGFKE